MDSERWHLVSDILGEAMELPETAREAYLAERCGSDTALRQEVEALMTASGRGGLLPADPEARQVDLLGKTVGRYRVDSLIGVGGMGKVYRGTDLELGRAVALKVLSEDTRLDFHAAARFKREARLLASLNHPNIGAIYDLEEWDGQSILVLEYVEGPTLEELLEEQGPLSVQEASRVAIQIGRALEAAHQRGIVHRDLKPANVVLTPRGRVKILDFGIAKPLLQADPEGTGDAPTPQNLDETVTGWRVGTPAYMSPEQVTRSAVDQRADIWGLGAILFQMISGHPPFGGEEPAERMRRILDDDPDWSRLSTSVPRALRSLIERCLVKDRAERLQSVDAAVATLEAVANPRDDVDRTGLLASLRRQPGAAAVVIAFVLAVVVLTTRRAPVATADDPARILVLPFQFLGNPDDSYLAEGISEEISHRLSGHANLAVLGRQTAVYASERDLNPREMAEELDADFLLEGTVRLQREADTSLRLRVRTALTSTESLSELWSHTYDSAAEDVFGLQAEVAARVADAIGVELPLNPLRGDLDTPELEAYDYYLRGNEYSRRSELESSMRSALELYELATERDPTFAAAWAAASIMRSRMRWRGYDPSEENLRQAKAAGDRALALNPAEGYAHLALGYYHYYGFRDYDEAFDKFTAAAVLRPNDPEVRYAVGVVARRMGSWDVAVDAFTSTLSGNPRNAEVAITLGETFIALGDFEQAARYLDRAIAIAPDRPGAYLFKSWLSLSSREDLTPAVDAIADGWETSGGTRLFELLGRYISDMDWWLTRALSPDERFQGMFAASSLLALGADSAAHYLHTAQFHHGRGDDASAYAYSDSARTLLEDRIAHHGALLGEDASVAARTQQSGRLAHLAIAYTGLGRMDEALQRAREAVDLLPEGADALHGSEIHVQLGIVQALAGDSEGAVRTFSEVFAAPSSFRPGMLHHDPILAPLLGDVTPRRPEAS